jgi:hypothetical protein
MWCADSLLHHGEEELPVRGLPQLVPRLPRGQQHLQHPQGVAWHLQAPGGDQESIFGALLMDVQSAIRFYHFVVLHLLVFAFRLLGISHSISH